MQDDAMGPDYMQHRRQIGLLTTIDVVISTTLRPVINHDESGIPYQLRRTGIHGSRSSPSSGNIASLARPENTADLQCDYSHSISRVKRVRCSPRPFA